MAMNWPQSVEDLVLISSTYDKSQLSRLGKMKRPTLIIWAEDDLVAQLKAGYLLRDSIGTSRLEVLGAVAKNPHYDFTIAHKLERYKKDVIISPDTRLPLFARRARSQSRPKLEPELRGLAVKEREGRRELDGLPGGHRYSFLLVLLLHCMAVRVAGGGEYELVGEDLLHRLHVPESRLPHAL